ncbi:hypothetical protein TNCT_619391 [Trichonephila clavata]|uniref:Uncharacterized protein n=1 Tax=Trichonephila clavata TaxID=2740835 RepID=A0A8X6HQT2_TRICU|nr:hypothetical protein TNCT_619391 [Trichonephila clavata]
MCNKNYISPKLVPNIIKSCYYQTIPNDTAAATDPFYEDGPLQDHLDMQITRLLTTSSDERDSRKSIDFWKRRLVRIKVVGPPPSSPWLVCWGSFWVGDRESSCCLRLMRWA